MKDRISQKVLNRLTLYHSLLVEYIESEVDVISSPQIASRLLIDDSQVRKDFKFLKRQGRCRVGYDVKELKDSIEETLRFQQKKDAFIIGAGNLGLALAKYDGFSDYGLNILSLFDNNSQKVGTMINKKEVFHISKLPDLIERLNVELAILTVPRFVAQETTDLLVKSGIKSIWNFTPAVLKVPADVNVLNESLIASFLQFAGV